MTNSTTFNRNLEETLLAEFLINDVFEHAVGRVDDECWHNFPRDVYFIGNLRPLAPPHHGNQPAHWQELQNKIAPFAFGADFLIAPESNSIRLLVKVKWSCYYRIFPTFEQQISQQDAQAENNLENIPENLSSVNIGETAIDEENESDDELQETSENTADGENNDRIARTRDSLFIRFRKISCATGSEIVFRNNSGAWQADFSAFQEALNDECQRAVNQAIADPDCLRVNGNTHVTINVPATALASENDYIQYITSLQTSVVPNWRWRVQIPEATLDENYNALIQIVFANASPLQNPPDKVDIDQALNPNIEPFFFDTEAAFYISESRIEPFELEIAPRGFRYDRKMWGRGFNCNVEFNEGNRILTTTHIPIYRQMRYSTKEEPRPDFALLSTNPVPMLREILSAMSDYLHVWDEQYEEYRASQPDWETLFGANFIADRQKFVDEIESFRRGLELIETNSDIRLAFELTNESFRRVGQFQNKTAWRLFQIVFLVSQIPGIAALSDPNLTPLSERERVDIIYFPTGGGKTEAYLGTLAFHCFFDRLRGKTAGVTAWTRFPLRLLTLQQTQRVADVIGTADIVRREHNDPRLSGQRIAGFAVGYFVGKEGTPNEIYNTDSDENAKSENIIIWAQARDEAGRQLWKRLIFCPACQTKTVSVTFDEQRTRLYHRCSNQNCPFPDGIIPVYVVDNEIYRYLPTVIVGTIDKLASLGNQRKLAQIFGQIDGICINHGYYKGKCCQKDCSDNSLLRHSIPQGLSSPTLFIQDELHLLKEGLGTFDAHYESFTQELKRYFGDDQPLKIIASSATIEAFERQIEHLYARNEARVFPGLGQTLTESFYAETRDYPQRMFVGILPHNKTIFNAILELIELYIRTVQNLQNLSAGVPNPYGGQISPGTDEWQGLLDVYQTSLTYFLAKRELDSILTDISSHTNPNLEDDGLHPLEVLNMTGMVTTDEVTARLEHLMRRLEPNENPNIVLATSMISHGVDVDRFNSMLFYGMPRQTAEYIQASSRVGRSHVGIVFDCFHPVRERDRSHYDYFVKYHEFLGQLVEPVAINRWSKYSINRTLPGLFMAVLLQIMSNRPGVGTSGGRYFRRDYVAQQISAGNIQPDEFINILKNAYRVTNPTEQAQIDFESKINSQVAIFFDQILSRTDGWLSNALFPKPMNSLRDVEELLPVDLD